jgi:predicted DNA-binding transcriptional regulator AlpA
METLPLTLKEVAAKLGLSELVVRQLRERCPPSLPTPYSTRPLLWRDKAISDWSEARGLKLT